MQEDRDETFSLLRSLLHLQEQCARETRSDHRIYVRLVRDWRNLLGI